TVADALPIFQDADAGGVVLSGLMEVGDALRPTTFPCTTLFRSGRGERSAAAVGAGGASFEAQRLHGVQLGRLASGEEPEEEPHRSEEHTSELQSRGQLVCRLLLEKKNPLQGRRPPPDRNSTRLN